MLSLFSSSSPFDEEVESATDGVTENWQKIMDICDRANENETTAKDCLNSIMTRLKNPDPHITLQAITLLDACVNNCGIFFHLLIASRDFEKEYKKLLQSSNREVKNQLLAVLKSWAEGEFKDNPKLNLIPSLYNNLKREGWVFPTNQKTVASRMQDRLIYTQNRGVSKEEAEDLAKAIELSLKESSSPKGKSVEQGGSSSLYPSTSSLATGSSPPEGRKVRAVYDFEAAEDNELTFKSGEIIYVTDDSDPNWWKGTNKRGEGLFPSNFVSSDLSAEAEQPKVENKKTVQFDEAVKVKKITKEEVEIDEVKMDRLLHYLHEADPNDPSGDSPEMLQLLEEVNEMGPLIDAELEAVDSKHAQLTQLCMDIVEALKLYRTLMGESSQPGPSYVQKPLGYSYPQPQVNGIGPSGVVPGPYTMVQGGLPPHMVQSGPISTPFLSDPAGRPTNGIPPYGGAPPQIPHGIHQGYQPVPGPPVLQGPHPSLQGHPSGPLGQQTHPSLQGPPSGLQGSSYQGPPSGLQGPSYQGQLQGLPGPQMQQQGPPVHPTYHDNQPLL